MKPKRVDFKTSFLLQLKPTGLKRASQNKHGWVSKLQGYSDRYLVATCLLGGLEDDVAGLAKRVRVDRGRVERERVTKRLRRMPSGRTVTRAATQRRRFSNTRAFVPQTSKLFGGMETLLSFSKGPSPKHPSFWGRLNLSIPLKKTGPKYIQAFRTDGNISLSKRSTPCG